MKEVDRLSLAEDLAKSYDLSVQTLRDIVQHVMDSNQLDEWLDSLVDQATGEGSEDGYDRGYDDGYSEGFAEAKSEQEDQE